MIPYSILLCSAFFIYCVCSVHVSPVNEMTFLVENLSNSEPAHKAAIIMSTEVGIR